LQKKEITMLHTRILAIAPLALVMGGLLGSCATAPKTEKQADFLARSDSTRVWFEQNVTGLRRQIDNSAGYVVFPDIAQWGILIGGGRFGRGEVCEPDGTQIGWAAINVGSVGLQAGVRGFRMVMVLQDETAMNAFKNNALAGSVSGVLVGGESGGSGVSQFRNGVAIYEGASSGLMAGVNIGLDVIRFQPLDAG
jgi:lipid-binding SYLF domain-containing protein